MKDILKYSIFALIVATVLYLSASFVAMDCNPRNWDVISRFFLTLMFLGTTITSIIVEIESKKPYK